MASTSFASDKPVQLKTRLGALSQQEAQNRQDAELHKAFDEGDATKRASFGGSQGAPVVDPQKPWEQMEAKAYLQRMQRAGLTQPHGVMLVVQAEARSLRIVAHSENASEMLELPPEAVAFGMDARQFFSEASAALLHKECGQRATGRQPLAVQLRSSAAQFYALIHKCEAGMILDLEPVKPKDEQGLSVAGAKLDRTMAQVRHPAAQAITKIQNLPGGDLLALCQTVVEEVREMTGYDRVMAYKFHEDEHGEVVAESVRDDLVPYLGLHFPATDIPQAIRLLMVRPGGAMRMICNAGRPMVRVLQSEEFEDNINLSDSTLRAPHGCHAQYMVNMGSAASLTLAVVVHDKKDELDPHEEISPSKQKLWGLVVCHHCTPRYCPFPLRKGCEFLMQTFGEQLNHETLLAANAHEEAILRTQTQLCDMLEHDVPLGVVRESPTVMDLITCDGAALYFGGRFWLLGTTPTERQIKDIADWLLSNHKKKVGVRTESLSEAGYPDADALGDAVCGMVAARIRQRDFIFWFRGHTAKEVRWGGARHVKGEKDDGRRMHPRNSFQAFLDVVKKRSLPWQDVEMDAITSLQVMLNDSLDKMGPDAVIDLDEMGGTNIDGTPASGGKILPIRDRSAPPAYLSSDAMNALEQFKTPFYVTDATREDFPVVYASHTFTAQSQYSVDECKGRESTRLLQGPDTDERELERMHVCAARGLPYAGRVLGYKKDGTPFWTLVALCHVKDDVGNLVNHVIMSVEMAKYTLESPVAASTPTSPAHSLHGEKGLPISLIRYDARIRDQALRSGKDIVDALLAPSLAAAGRVASGGFGGAGGDEDEDELSLLGMPNFAPPMLDEQQLPVEEPARRRSIVGLMFAGSEKIDDFVKATPPEAEELEHEARKRRTHKGIDMGTTLERITKAFFITDPRLEDNPIVFASDHLLRLTEYGREDLIGNRFRCLQGACTDPSEAAKVHKAVSAEKDCVVQWQLQKKDGEAMWNIFHLKIVKGADGGVQYFIGVVHPCEGRVSDDLLKRELLAVYATASSVTEALRDLPDTALVDKLWLVHSKAVKPKPHMGGEEGWTAIKRVMAEEGGGRLGVKHFRPIKPLGTGDTGSVYLVELRGTSQLYAMKTMEKETMVERNKVHRVAAEREILEAMDHPFLPVLYSSFQTAKHVCLITEFCGGGELYGLLECQPGKRFDEHVAKFYAAEILLALEYLHCQGVIYRDLKPENVLLTSSGHIVITDFDLSVHTSAFPKVIHPQRSARGGKKGKKARGGVGRAAAEERPLFVAEPLARSNSFVGTEEYIAPEIVSGAGHSGSVDWWAFGILVYEMLFGKTPFCGSSIRRTFQNVLTKELPFPSNIRVSMEAKHLIKALLSRNPETRLGGQCGAAEIKAHPWFDGINFTLIRSRQVATPKVPFRAPDFHDTGLNTPGHKSSDSWSINPTHRPSVDSTRSSGVFNE